MKTEKSFGMSVLFLIIPKLRADKINEKETQSNFHLRPLSNLTDHQSFHQQSSEYMSRSLKYYFLDLITLHNCTSLMLAKKILRRWHGKRVLQIIFHNGLKIFDQIQKLFVQVQYEQGLLPCQM